MLVKCVCTSCGHSYLADNQIGNLECPRCKTPNKSPGPAPFAGGSPRLDDESAHEPMPLRRSTGMANRFDPEAPPPMYITRERVVRGFVFGGLASALVGGALGGALAALGLAIPAVAGIAVGLVAGAVCRYGFGGRSIVQTQLRAMVVATLVSAVGISGFLAGGWAVGRLTGQRAEMTRKDLDAGLQALFRKRAATKDEGEKVLLDSKIYEVEQLKRRSDARLEDYLWVQQAQINQPLLAYGKLRALHGPIFRFGPDHEPIHVPPAGSTALLLGELLLAVILACRGILPRS